MFTRIAIFKWKAGTKETDVASTLREIKTLQDEIPGIIEISTGENQSKYAEGYTHVVLVRGENQRAVEAYRDHPDHKAVAAKIEVMEERGIGVDFETK